MSLEVQEWWPYLWPVPKEPAAIGGPAPTDCFLITQTVEIVVKGQLCPWGRRQTTLETPAFP